MSDQIFHCAECHRLGPAEIKPGHGIYCPGCGNMLTEQELKPKVAPVRKSGTKVSESGKGEPRRRSAVMVGERDHIEETKRANLLVLGSLIALFIAGFSFAGFKWYESYKAEKRLAKAPGVAESKEVLSSYVKLDSEDETEKALRKILVEFIKAYYKDPLVTNRIGMIVDSGLLASRFENFYIHHSDKPDLDDTELLGIYQSRLPNKPLWLVRMRFGSQNREFVVFSGEEGLRLDWQHLATPSLDDWEGFLKQETQGEKTFRVYAWMVRSEANKDTILLRMACPLFVGSTELAEVTPILRIPTATDLGERLTYLFEEIPDDENEIGFPQGYREDDKMRQLTVRLRTEGQINQNPALVLEEVIAGDWVNLPEESRAKLAEARKLLKALTEDDELPVPAELDAQKPTSEEE